jgi:nucleoid-associated protein Lsr2
MTPEYRGVSVAKKTVVELIDDIDGSKADITVQFSWHGSSYEIDLSKKNAKAFEAAVEPYLSHATRAASGRAGRRSSARGKNDLSAVRSWATSNGYELATRGRIPAAVLEAYQAAGGSAGTRSGGAAASGARKTSRRRGGARKG